MKRILSRPLFSTLIFSMVLLCYTVLLHRDLAQRLPYPPTSDQTMYLAAGKVFVEQGRFMERAPLYALWMGAFYFAAGYDQEICFYLEKYVSFFLLGLSIACLGNRFFDLRTGLLMGLWALNCKYLVVETNGAHVMAATLYTCGILSFTLPNRDSRLPMAMFFLLLSTQARSEMWAPLIITASVIGGLAFRKWLRKDRVAMPVGRGKLRYWYAATAIAVVMLMIFYSRAAVPEPGRTAEAIAMNFALNYIDRNNLKDEYTGDDKYWIRIWTKVFSGAAGSVEAIDEDRKNIHPIASVRLHPEEALEHIKFNLKLFVRAFPAAFLAFDRPLLMLAAVAIYLASYLIWNKKRDLNDRWSALSPDDKTLLIVYMLAVFSLIPISLLLRVVSRYYLQLLPVLIMASVLWLRRVKEIDRINRILTGLTG